MTKEQAKIHGEVIKWWIDNPTKGLWFKNPNIMKEWVYIEYPSWDTDVVYLQNDEYIILRKALKDGEVIQHRFKSQPMNGKWFDIVENDDSIFKRQDVEYRIKPKEPTIKVGDYIVYEGETHLIKGKSYDLYEIEDGYYCKDNIIPWTLEEADDDEYVIVQFTVGTLPYPTIIKVKDVKYNEDIKWIVPYIGQTPEELGLKDR